MKSIQLQAILMSVCLLGLTLQAADSLSPMKSKVTSANFGKMPDGTAVEIYTLSNSKGISAKIMTLGGIITELRVPDKNGKLGNVVLGFDNLDQYVAGHPAFGALVGRFANRIAKGKFTLDNKEYTLALNGGKNHIHGGNKNFTGAVWKAESFEKPDGVGVKLTYFSKDGEEGYPGNLEVTVTYTLTEKDELIIDYTATTDKATPINLTNHCYFNLAGDRDVYDHELTVFASQYTLADADLIPTGEFAPVKNTALDFTKSTPIGKRIDQVSTTGGYDHNFVLDKKGQGPELAAIVHDPQSGRTMEVLTTQPGVQLYTGNWLNGKQKGSDGFVYKKHYGFCLETQHYPDSVNHPNFPSAILRPGDKFHEITTFRFTSK